MALAREVNDGLRALFLPQHGRRPWVGRRWWFICPRTDGERKIVSAERHAFTFAPECACGEVLIVTARHPIEHGRRLLGSMRRNHIANRVLLVGWRPLRSSEGVSSLGEFVGHVVVGQACS
jgi:hypothetical protein